MSTYWYFECLDHDPSIVSRDEFTQHTDDHAYRLAINLAENRPVEPVDGHDYFEANARWFLTAHPICRLGLVDEYGNRAKVEARLVITPKGLGDV